MECLVHISSIPFLKTDNFMIRMLRLSPQKNKITETGHSERTSKHTKAGR